MQIHWDIYHSSETFNRYEDEDAAVCVCARVSGWSAEAITAEHRQPWERGVCVFACLWNAKCTLTQSGFSPKRRHGCEPTCWRRSRIVFLAKGLSDALLAVVPF